MILDETNPSTTEYPGPLQATFDKIIASGYDEISTLFERTFKGYVKLTESTASIGNIQEENDYTFEYTLPELDEFLFQLPEISAPALFEVMQSQEDQELDIESLQSSLADIQVDLAEYATKEDFERLDGIQSTQSVNISSTDQALSDYQTATDIRLDELEAKLDGVIASLRR